MMQDKAIAIFQLGPVQSFISCARKTQDLWLGSYLLSYLGCCAMHVVADDGGRIIYPAITGQGIYDYAGAAPVGSKPPDGKELLSTVPNRFVAMLDHQRAAVVLHARNARRGRQDVSRLRRVQTLAVMVIPGLRACLVFAAIASRLKHIVPSF